VALSKIQSRQVLFRRIGLKPLTKTAFRARDMAARRVRRLDVASRCIGRFGTILLIANINPRARATRGTALWIFGLERRLDSPLDKDSQPSMPPVLIRRPEERYSDRRRSYSSLLLRAVTKRSSACAATTAGVYRLRRLGLAQRATD
jgi:hypothetical protein